MVLPSPPSPPHLSYIVLHASLILSLTGHVPPSLLADTPEACRLVHVPGPACENPTSANSVLRSTSLLQREALIMCNACGLLLYPPLWASYPRLELCLELPILLNPLLLPFSLAGVCGVVGSKLS